MNLGTKSHTAGNATRYFVDYSEWLEEGESLASGTVVLDSASSSITDVTISGVATTPSNHLVFVLSGGSVNETLTLAVRTVTSRGEIKNDTAGFTIVAP